jgi:hypothetical protein
VASDNHLTADHIAVRNEVDPGPAAAVRMVVSGDVDAVAAVKLQQRLSRVEASRHWFSLCRRKATSAAAGAQMASDAAKPTRAHPVLVIDIMSATLTGWHFPQNICPTKRHSIVGYANRSSTQPRRRHDHPARQVGALLRVGGDGPATMLRRLMLFGVSTI